MTQQFEVQTMPASQGWDWIKRGFALFQRSPGIWIGIVLIFAVIQLLGNVVPLGGLVLGLLGPVFTAGILFGCRDLEAGKELEIGHLFAGFRSPRTGALVLLGLFVMLLIMAAVIVIGVFAALAMGGVDIEAGNLGLNAVLSLLLISLLFMAPALMAIWFSTQLVALHGLDPLPALKASFAGCLKNLGPLTVYGLILIPLSIVAMIPMGLGLLVLMPTVMAANYFSYLDVYGEGSEQSMPIQPSLID